MKTILSIFVALLFVYAVTGKTSHEKKQLSKDAIEMSKVRDVFEAVSLGEEKLKKYRRNIPDNLENAGESFFTKSARSYNLESQAIVGLEAAKRLVETTGMTTRELREDDIIDTALRDLVCQEDSVNCYEVLNDNFLKNYRTMDGSCNNKENPKWGMAFSTQKRFIPPAYDGPDDSPRVSSDPMKPLPSAREISNRLFNTTGKDVYDKEITNLVMAWGQFIDHDCISTPTSGNLNCCNDTVAGANGDKCFIIPVPENDNTFDTCLNFVRSAPALDDCNIQQREQINQLTAYIDANMVYGSSKNESDVLREPSPNDHLLTTHNNAGKLLPKGPSFCFITDDPINDYCQHAGEGRVNTAPHLGLMHTMFMLLHNKIATELRKENPEWTTEKVFQETRKIVGAIIQHITYNEWLPVVIGKNEMDKYNLKSRKLGHHDPYSSTVNVQIRNAFAAAALRYGHSLIRGDVSYLGSDYITTESKPMQDQLLNPHMVIQDGGSRLQDLLRHVSYDKSMEPDSKFDDSVRNKLFGGHDLPARNLQRGRDHGLKPYYKFREFCELSKDLKDISSENKEIIKDLYSNRLEDIDLYVGGMGEIHVPGGDVGPTFACLIAKQFDFFKRGDSFWYERKSFQGKQFTSAQLDEIRKFKMADLMCNVFKIKKIQKDPFRQLKTCQSKGKRSHKPHPQHPPPECHANPWRNCENSKFIDLLKWKQQNN